jgi:chromatin assembly factor 1 subunit B
VQFAATLARHVKPVNCVRFSPNGQYLASASDGGIVVLWRQTSAPVRVAAMFGAEEDDCCDPSNGMADDYVEHWGAAQMFRASDLEDIYDLAWSPDSRFILFGLTDHSVQIWDVTSGQKVKVIKEHGHFVQGAAWDPLNVFIATQSADR